MKTQKNKSEKNISQTKRINKVVIFLSFVLAIVLIIPGIIPKMDTFADDNQELNASDLTVPTDLIENEGDVVKTFTNAYEALEFAQDKINKLTNFKSIAESNLNIPIPVVNASANSHLYSISKVQENGLTYCEDIIYTTPTWLNGHKSIVSVVDTKNDKVCYNETLNVSSHTSASYANDTWQNYTMAEFKEKMGLLDDRLFIDASRENIEAGAELTKTDYGYAIKFSMKETGLRGILQKLYIAGTLDGLPTLRKFQCVMQIDKYGNIIQCVYKLSVNAARRIDWGFIHQSLGVTMSGTITQKISKLETQDIVMPA